MKYLVLFSGFILSRRSFFTIALKVESSKPVIQSKNIENLVCEKRYSIDDYARDGESEAV